MQHDSPIKQLNLIGTPLYTYVPTKNAKLLTPSVKFGQDRNGRSEKKYVTIPYSNCSESAKDSWFVSYYAHVPTRNAKLLTPSVGGQ